MAELVEEDERPKRADECDEDQPEGRLREHQRQATFIDDSTRSRVVRSISSTSAIDCGAAKLPWQIASSTVSAMWVKRIAPSRKLATAISLAALRTIGAAPPASRASRARRS